MEEKGEKPEVLEAVLKETVDLVMDLYKCLCLFSCGSNSVALTFRIM